MPGSMFRGSRRNQYFAAASTCIGYASIGIAYSWPSPTLVTLQSPETPLLCGPLSLDNISWIVSLLCFGCIFGTLFATLTVNRFGCIMSKYLFAVPGILSWVLIMCAQNVYYLLIARFLVGIYLGGLLVIIPIYIVEIAEVNIRGILGSIGLCFTNVGIITGYAVGSYFSYNTATIIFGCLTLIYLLTVIFLPETPSFLARTNKLVKAELNLAYYRNVNKYSYNISSDYIYELEELRSLRRNCDKDIENAIETSNKIQCRDFLTPPAPRALIIGFFLMAFNQMSGSLSITSYAGSIFKESGSQFDSNISSIIIGAIQLAGTVTLTLIIEKTGRKHILIVTSICAGLAYLVMSGYGYLRATGYDTINFGWIPLVSISFACYLISTGVCPLTFFILYEIMPENIRVVGISYCITVLGVWGFLSVKYFYVISIVMGMHGCMLIFAITCFCCAIFVGLFVPETQGKTLKEIQIELE